MGPKRPVDFSMDVMRDFSFFVKIFKFDLEMLKLERSLWRLVESAMRVFSILTSSKVGSGR